MGPKGRPVKNHWARLLFVFWLFSEASVLIPTTASLARVICKVRYVDVFRNIFSILPMLDTRYISIANRLTVSHKIILTAYVCDEHTVGTAPIFSNSGLANPS